MLPQPALVQPAYKRQALLPPKTSLGSCVFCLSLRACRPDCVAGKDELRMTSRTGAVLGRDRANHQRHHHRRHYHTEGHILRAAGKYTLPHRLHHLTRTDARTHGA